MIATWGASNGLNSGLSFFLPLSDAGAGAVNTTPASSAGSPTPTFTRATVAWTKLSTGLWAQVASGTARSCYLGADTAVGAYGGYFAERAGTQLVTPTASIRDMTDASWVLGATMSVAKNATGIDGVSNSASTLTGGAVTATNTILQTLTAAATSRTYSAFVRRKTGTGTITLMQGTATLDITALINSTTYTRVSLNDNELNVAFGFKITTNGDAIEVDFNQFEAGSFASSPMDAAGAVRNKDSLLYVLSGNFSNTDGSFYAEVTLNDWSATGPPSASPVPINVNAAGAPVLALITTFSGLRVTDNANTALGPAGTPSGKMKYGGLWTGTTLQAIANGSAGTAGTFDGSMNGGTNFGVGCDVNGDSNLYGMIQNLRFYSPSKYAAQLQAMTA